METASDLDITRLSIPEGHTCSVSAIHSYNWKWLAPIVHALSNVQLLGATFGRGIGQADFAVLQALPSVKSVVAGPADTNAIKRWLKKSQTANLQIRTCQSVPAWLDEEFDTDNLLSWA